MAFSSVLSFLFSTHCGHYATAGTVPCPGRPRPGTEMVNINQIMQLDYKKKPKSTAAAQMNTDAGV